MEQACAPKRAQCDWESPRGGCLARPSPPVHSRIGVVPACGSKCRRSPRGQAPPRKPPPASRPASHPCKPPLTEAVLPPMTDRMPRLAIYQPDIPQNTGTMLRLSACLGVPVEIIEPAAFDVSDRNLRRSGMDYLNSVT